MIQLVKHFAKKEVVMFLLDRSSKKCKGEARSDEKQKNGMSLLKSALIFRLSFPLVTSKTRTHDVVVTIN